MQFKKIVGNYKDVTDALGLPDNFYSTSEDANETLGNDIPRTFFFNAVDFTKTKKTALLSIPFSYTQGNLMGDFFSGNAFQLSLLASQNLNYRDKECPLVASLKFSYLNDVDVLCGFSINYAKGIGVHEGKYFLNIAIIEDTLASPENRKVTFITSSELLPEQENFHSRNPNIIHEIAQDAITRDVILALNCDDLAKHIRGGCKGNEDAFLYLGKLQTCFQLGKNANWKQLEEVSKSPSPAVEQMLLFAQEHALLSSGMMGFFVASMVLVTAATCGVAMAPVELVAVVGVGLFAAALTYGAMQYTSKDDALVSNINSHSCHQ